MRSPDALRELAARTLPRDARVLDLADAPDPLRALPPGGPAHDAALLAFPTRAAPLIPLLQALHDALPEGGLVVACDLVWQTAPTPEILRAFASPAGRDKVRPIEGYEMQAEHAGFAIVSRETLPIEIAVHTPEQTAAVKADARGAARVVGWVFRRT